MLFSASDGLFEEEQFYSSTYGVKGMIKSGHVSYHSSSPFMSKVFKILIPIENFLFIIVQHKSSYNLAISTQSHQEKVNINLNVI